MKINKQLKDALKKIGRIGGNTTLKRHGKKHMTTIAKKGYQAMLKKRAEMSSELSTG